ncbi:MAG: class I SAM-dependent rRNA methyltransferase [Verrucomicrobiae bacterium]|nr:class I SAM-dependent rRNA methyltransferase [Verrucomicrobiae bacterium]
MKHWREHLQAAPDAETTAWRLFNGKGFRWGGIWIDNFDGHWLVQTTKDKFPEPFREAVESGEARSIYWKHREKVVKGTPQWIAGEVVKEPFPITENGITYLIDFDSGYSQGIFLDQRENRRRLMDRVQPGERILNCFAYTCAFSVAAAKVGGITSSLDLSSPYLDWGKLNLENNGIDPKSQYFCKGDVFEWLATFHRQERRFRGVILDPPTFSRNQKGKIFKADKDYADLVALACGVLEEDAWILCTGNTHHLDNRSFEMTVRDGVRRGRRIVSEMETFPMPPEYGEEDYLKTAWVTVA